MSDNRHIETAGTAVAVTGSSGLVGRALTPFLLAKGYRVVRLVRKRSDQLPPPGVTSVYWNPQKDELDPACLEEVFAVVHLAGENVAQGRWTDERKRRIRDSRVQSSRLLASVLSQLNRPPAVFFSASAVGFYAPGGDMILTESDPPGTGFLSEVCVAWERAVRDAEQSGIRTVMGRLGVVLSAQGGALAQQLPLFRWGLAGRLGSGSQYVPWIVMDDLLRAIHHCLTKQEVSGPVNMTTPEPVTNREFTKILAGVLRRPAFLPVPAWALRLALGEMADELLLPSLRVVPERLRQTGFVFEYPGLEAALRHELQLATTVNP